MVESVGGKSLHQNFGSTGTLKAKHANCSFNHMLWP